MAAKGERKFNTVEFGNKAVELIRTKHRNVFFPIDELVGALRDNLEEMPPSVVAEYVVKLSTYLVNLGSLVAISKSEANEAYVYRKYREVWHYSRLRDEMKSDKACEKQSFDLVFEEYRSELINRYIADYLCAYYDDVSRLVMAAQSRMNVLRDEMFAARRQV